MDTAKVKVTARPERKLRGLFELEFGSLANVMRQAWWMGLGAAAMGWDEVGSFTGRLVDRGESIERESRKLVRSAIDQPKKTANSAEEEVEKRLRELLDRLDIPTREDIRIMSLPTRADIEALDAKVTSLGKRVDQLRKLEEPQIERAEALAGQIEALKREVRDLKKMEEPQARETERLAGKIGTLTRKVGDLQKIQEGPDGGELQPEVQAADKTEKKAPAAKKS